MRPLMMLAAFVIAIPDRSNPDKEKKEDKTVQEQLLGEWQFSKVEFGGMAQPDLNMRETSLIFEKDVIHVRENGQMKPNDDATYILDPSKTPIAFDLLPKRGGDVKMQGILKLEGDTLTLCFSANPKGNGRPTAFESTAKGDIMLMQLKRIKK